MLGRRFVLLLTDCQRFPVVFLSHQLRTITCGSFTLASIVSRKGPRRSDRAPGTALEAGTLRRADRSDHEVPSETSPGSPRSPDWSLRTHVSLHDPLSDCRLSRPNTQLALRPKCPRFLLPRASVCPTCNSHACLRISTQTFPREKRGPPASPAGFRGRVPAAWACRQSEPFIKSARKAKVWPQEGRSDCRGF